mmetsp:Transcript_37430/g.105651  ORF Transcript_37430/g.105651 Transcript_37430/m.105651 type:complete len:200 (+) Transcript_37430:1743-2342(+)
MHVGTGALRQRKSYRCYSWLLAVLPFTHEPGVILWYPDLVLEYAFPDFLRLVVPQPARYVEALTRQEDLGFAVVRLPLDPVLVCPAPLLIEIPGQVDGQQQQPHHQDLLHLGLAVAPLHVDVNHLLQLLLIDVHRGGRCFALSLPLAALFPLSGCSHSVSLSLRFELFQPMLVLRRGLDVLHCPVVAVRRPSAVRRHPY